MFRRMPAVVQGGYWVFVHGEYQDIKNRPPGMGATAGGLVDIILDLMPARASIWVGQCLGQDRLINNLDLFP